MQTEAIYNLIRTISIFNSVPDDTLRVLAGEMSMLSIKGGQTLIQQGEAADCLYILAHGRMLVSFEGSDGVSHKVGEIGVGDVVGEMALLTDLPRSASVKALRDCDLIKIDQALFKSITKEHTEAAMGFVSACVKRLLPNFTEKKHGIKTLCVVPCDKNIETKNFRESLCSALGQYSDTKVIDSSDPDIMRLLKQDKSALMSWLSKCEREHELVVYFADPGLSDFTRLALSQADKILRVTTPQPDLNHDLLTYLKNTPSILAEKYLVILHEASTKIPQHTAALLEKIPSNEHFHVAKTGDYERLARYLLGRTVSLVFSGGGLRGIAHHGLVQALYERNIPIDMVGGTSFGGLPTVFCGLGISPEEMLESWKRLVHKIKNVVDLTLPIAALGKGEVLYEVLSDAMPENIHMEDLWIPAFTVSTDISNFCTVMHRTGPAWEAVRASLSIPGIFPPVIDGERVLVDGASLNNLPVDLMGSINNQGTIIASIASGKPEHKTYAGYDHALSGWRALPDMLRHKDHPMVPNIVSTMLSASLSASTVHQAQMCIAADYALDLGVDHYPLLDVEQWIEMRDTGYKNACKLLDELEITPRNLGL